jgi:hypothetical protein
LRAHDSHFSHFNVIVKGIAHIPLHEASIKVDISDTSYAYSIKNVSGPRSKSGMPPGVVLPEAMTIDEAGKKRMGFS